MADSSYHYVVEGRGEFPTDMLRYDRSEPVGATDKALVAAKLGSDDLLEEKGDRKGYRRYQVTLRATDNRAAPATKRWESFGFRVISVGSDLFGLVSAPASPGRPRIHPEGSTGAERALVGDVLLRQSGGVRRTIRFSPAGVSALAAIREHSGETADTDVIERLLLKEQARVTRISGRQS